MRSRSVSGQVTVFSAIILLAVLTLAGVLADISRIQAGRSIVKRAAEASARSLLANYSSRLKENYGIFALSVKDESALEDKLAEYLSGNLSIPEEGNGGGGTDLYGFRIEKVSVTPVFNLSENEVTRQQILEYMKYRAPKQLAEGFIERLSAFKELGKMSAAYKKKVGIDKMLGGMDKSQQKLKKAVNGSGTAGERFINGFNSSGAWENTFRSYNSYAASLASLQSSLDSVNSSIITLEAQLQQEKLQRENSKAKGSFGGAGSTGAGDGDGGDSRESGAGGSNGGDSRESGEGGSNSGDSREIGAGGSSDEGAAENGEDNGINGEDNVSRTEKAIASLQTERASIEGSINQTNSLLQGVLNELRNTLTGDYVQANERAVNEIEAIVEKGKRARLAIADLESYLEQNFGNGTDSISKDFGDKTRSELENLKRLVLDGERAQKMLGSAEGNSSLLNTVVQKLDAAGFGGRLPEELVNMIKGYANIRYDYSKPQNGNASSDPRQGKTQEIRQLIVEKLLKDVNYETDGINKKDLPSVTKKITDDFAVEDEQYVRAQWGDKGKNTTKAAEAAYGGKLDHIGEEADLYNEEGMFQENALGFLSDIGSLVSGEAAALRDNVYLNEYIMGTFKNSVSKTRQGNESVPEINLHGIEKSSLTTYYDSEVEYILHGNASQKLNNMMTRGEVLLVRFGLDTLHVYMDAKKKSMAAGIATAVAGWWTGGAGIPIISNLIMCGWGMGEAVLDVRELMDGKAVPIYKMNGDWKLDIGLPKADVPKTDQRLYFSYQDYLRLFLLTMDETKKLNRLEDVIQLNIGREKSGFQMSACNTYVRVEAEVSMKYLFITQPFFPKRLKTDDGRYVFKVLVYEGY